MSLTHKLTHASEARDRLLEELKTVAGWAATLDLLNVQTQAVEDALWQLYTERWLTTAVGAQLDVIGRILDEPRAGSIDAIYLERLKAKIRVLRSSGAAPDILKIFKLLLPLNNIFFTTMGAAGFILYLGVIDLANVPTYVRFIYDAKSAGINAQLSYDIAGDLFTLSTDDTTQTDTLHGFGNFPDDGVGGIFSDAS